MTRLMILTCLTAGLCFGNSYACAADESDAEPKLHLVQSSANRLLQDLDPVMRLTSPKEQEKTAEIREYLDLSFVGMKLDKLMRMDFLFGEGPIRYRPAFPLENEQVFWTQNLIPNGIQKQLRMRAGLYKTRGAFNGYMRTRDGYAIFGEKLKDLPALAPPPQEAVEHLLDLTKNAAMELINTPEGVQYRRNSYNDEKLGLRQELQKQVVKSKSESQDAFELRTLSSEHMLDHVERLYVEAKYARLLGHFNPENATGRFDLLLEAIPNTSLEKHFQQLNQQPLSFANVPKAAKSNMSLRVRLPLDELLQRHGTETIALLRKISHNDVAKNEVKTADQKEASAEVIDLVFNLLLKNVQGGMADGFLESHPNSGGTNTAIAAAKAVDGNAPLEILKRLEKTRDGQKVTMDIAKVNGVSIHSFLVSEEQIRGFDDFFGGPEMYVGTSEDTIWLGAGPQAVQEMQVAIQEAAKPNTGKAGDPFFTLSGRIAPWLEFHQTTYPDSGGEMFRKYRNMMVEAGQPGDDHFEMWLNREGESNKVAGTFSSDQGWTRFVGKYLADMFK